MLKEFIYKNYIKIIRILICNIIYISMNFDIKITPDTLLVCLSCYFETSKIEFFQEHCDFSLKKLKWVSVFIDILLRLTISDTIMK